MFISTNSCAILVIEQLTSGCKKGHFLFVNRAYSNTNCYEFYAQIQGIMFISPNVFTMTLPISINYEQNQ